MQMGRRASAERIEFIKKSADPRFGVLDHVVGETVGGGLPPPTPSAWAPSAQPLGPIRLFALFTKIGAYHWLKSKNPAPPSVVNSRINLTTLEESAQPPRRGWLKSPGRPKALPRVWVTTWPPTPRRSWLKARMTECEVSVLFWGISGQMPARCWAHTPLK